MPARTALRRLAAEQALDVLPSGTVVVPRMTRPAFTELGAIRADVEPLAVRLAAPHLDRSAHETLAGIIRGGSAARAENDPEKMLRADREFLFTLYRAAGAPMLLGIIEALWLRRGPLFWDARWIIIGRVPSGNRHSAILDALRAGDGSRAAAELRIEIESTTTYLLKQVRFADDPAPPGDLDALPPISNRPPRGPGPAAASRT